MKSNEVLSKAMKDVGVKSVAHDMNLSASLIYKWAQGEYNVGSADNPLDRIIKLHKLTGDDNIIQWVCNSAGGFFVKNIEVEGMHSEELFKSTQSILKEFSEMLAAITDSKLDGEITGNEAESIRKEWEDLKSVTEQFVISCENGSYRGND
jgi:hypothetical protein